MSLNHFEGKIVVKRSQLFRYLLVVLMLFPTAQALSEDIDLYAGTPNVSGVRANVLVVIDNSANWNAANQGWPGGVAQGQSELAALATVLASVSTKGSVNVGLMMFAKKSDLNVNGGYVRYALRDISEPNNLQALQSILNGMRADGVFNDFQADTASSQYGDLMHEAYRYFSGGSPIAGGGNAWRDYPASGSPGIYPYTAQSLGNHAQTDGGTYTTYRSPLSASSPCAKNYIIFIGNGYPSNGSPTPSDSNFVNFNFNQIYQETNSTKTTWADEWARYLHDVGAYNLPTGTDPDGTAITADGKISTYTINVFKDQEDVNQTKLLKSMASVGGGEYFQASSAGAIEFALTSIFNQIQAVNSVFTSASLPISVNTQGTYLNQVYMGVFRPDGSGRPRWQGNLKHYKFGLTTDVAGNDTIFLADKDGVAAISPLSGFIKPDATSFWSSSTFPAAGFWSYRPSGVGGQYDAPDGDLVEKGAVAQKLRGMDARSVATGSTARKVYTCEPNCSVSNEPSLFATSNSALVTRLTSTSVPITSISRSGTTATAITSTAHGLSDGERVTISSSSVPAYNGSWTIQYVDATTFRFTVLETPASPATSAVGIKVSSGTSVTQSGASFAFNSASSYATVTLANHGFVTGQTVTVSGVPVSAGMSGANVKCTGYQQSPAVDSPCEYNGSFQVTVTGTNQFQYLMPPANLGATQVTTTVADPPEAVDGRVIMYCGTNAGNAVSQGAITTRFLNSTASGAFTGVINVSVPKSEVGAGCFGSGGNSNDLSRLQSFTVTNTGSPKLDVSHTTFSSTTCSGTPATCGLSFTVVQGTRVIATSTTTITPSNQSGSVTGIPTRDVASISRSGNLVTLTTVANHGFVSPTTATVAGAEQAEYNGVKQSGSSNQNLLAPTDNTLTYTVTTGPATPASGGSVSPGSGINANALIEWIRGVDNKDDENQNGLLTDARASVHGDVLHSRPLVVNYGPRGGAGDVIMAFYGANDGLFRAVLAGSDPASGVEKWSFVAPEHVTTLGRLYNNSPLILYPNMPVAVSPTPTKRDYFFDGNVGVYQSPDRATTHIFITTRRGGRLIYALDVSDPFVPKFLWKKSATDFSELGYTFSEPKIVPIKRRAGLDCKANDPDTFTLALVMGAGYDPAVDDGTSGGVRNATMGRGVFVLEAATGNLIKLLQPTDSSRKYSVPGDVTLLDANYDGCVDRIYAVDSGANIYRYDLNTPYPYPQNPSNPAVDLPQTATALAGWKTYKIAELGDVDGNGGSDDRRFLYATDAVRFAGLSEFTFLMVGSGDREKPLSTNIQDKFFVVKDNVQIGDDESVVTRSSGNTKQTKRIGDLLRKSIFDQASGSALNLFDTNRVGYYIDLETGEKTVNAALSIAGVTYFGTNTPRTSSRYSCSSNLGEARGYAINFASGTAAAGDRNDSGAVDRVDLYTIFIGGGLPPSPVTGVVEVDGKYLRFAIGVGGSGVEGSTIQGIRVQASPSSNRRPAYWYFNKD